MYSKDFFDEMKKELLKMKKSIILSIENEKSDFYDLIKDNSSEIVDQANNNFEQSFLEKLNHQDLQKLNLINLALSKIEDGTYGICEKSGKVIPETRLRAIPYAIYTIEVQSRIDKGF